jgi:thiamine biosynthesis protein ThiI
MREVIMCFSGEIALKGRNKSTFESILTNQIKQRIEKFGNFNITRAQSTFYIEAADEYSDIKSAYEKVKKVFGIANTAISVLAEKNVDRISETACEYLSDKLSRAKTFKVKAKRSDKTFPLTSPEICREVGHVILEKYPNLSVDVNDPQVTVMVEIRENFAYIHCEKEPGAGGIPVTSSGKGAIMLSGGIDSPVAAYMMAKRGMSLMAVHFASPPYTSERAKLKVISLCEKIVDYTGEINLHIVKFTEIQEYIRDNRREDLFTILMRRSMLRITQNLAKRYGAKAIITGESLGQVASQTIDAMCATNEAVDMLILRPLVGMDKTEIIETARKIDTYETSILPYEDCCTIFTPPHPKTKPKLSQILAAEEKMGMNHILEMEKRARDTAERIVVGL